MKKQRRSKRKKQHPENEVLQATPGRYIPRGNYKQLEQQEKQKFNQIFYRRFR